MQNKGFNKRLDKDHASEKLIGIVGSSVFRWGDKSYFCRMVDYTDYCAIQACTDDGIWNEIGRINKDAADKSTS